MARITSRYDCTALLQTFAVKFVLEVLGAAGAIWGSSEAIGLRTETNRPVFHLLACVVGVVFLARWLIQLQRAYRLLSRGDRIDMLSQTADDPGDDDLALYEEGDAEAGRGRTRRQMNRNGLDTAVAVATEIDSPYGTSDNDPR